MGVFQFDVRLEMRHDIDCYVNRVTIVTLQWLEYDG